MSGVLQALLAGFGGAATDEYFEYVTMLLPGNGTNGAQNNTFLDSSTNNFTITRNGNTTQGTFAPYGANWSNYFDGTGDYLTTTLSSAVTSTYTIDFWINTNTIAAGDGCILNIHTTAGNTNGIVIKRNGSQIQVNDGATAGTGPSGGTLSAGTWTFVTVVCNGTNTILYINGSSVSTYAGVSLSGSPTFVHIGHFGDVAGGAFAGYISNVRVVVGSANTPSSVVPTSPSTAITNTSLLTCQSNRFIDNSSNNFTITRNGDVSVQRFSPFNPTTPYAAGTIGGSGYFDGTGDYLTTPATGQFAPTGDFTIGFWVYPTTLNASNVVLGNYTTGASTDWEVEIVSSGKVNIYTNGPAIRIASATGLVTVGRWSYITVARSGTTITGYINGTSFGTYTQSGTFGSATKAIYAGIQGDLTLPYTGYISDVKLIDGSAVTTVPTAPQTATSGTNLLLNFTNGGIIDNAMMNDLETVGNAQISTGVSKFGGGSIAFDGSGDVCVSPNNPWMNLGSGSWTIEFWAYANSTNRADVISKGPSTTFNPFVVQLNTSGIIYVYISDTGSGYTLSLSSSSNAYTTGSWFHIAVVRNGNTVTIYSNGVSVGSGSYTGSPVVTTEPLGIGGATNANFSFNGYIDDLRITKGYARYTANFTPPTQAFPPL